MKTTLRPIVLATAVILATPFVAQADFSANIGVTSNYLWRGQPQSSDEAGISGGVDYSHKSGFYAGTWVSSLGGGSNYEQDWYLGYNFKLSSVDLDAGYIKYTYPIGNATLDFDEIYLNASMGKFNAGLAYTVNKEGNPADENDLYIFVGAEFEIKKGVTLGVTVGRYNYEAPATKDLTNLNLSLSKDDFTFALDKTNATDSGAGENDPRFSVSWSKSFDL